MLRDPHAIELVAAPDNVGPSEDLPLVTWSSAAHDTKEPASASGDASQAADQDLWSGQVTGAAVGRSTTTELELQQAVVLSVRISTRCD